MPIKTVLFDFMGTCLDWHSAVVASLPSELPESARSQLAIRWRHDYFDANSELVAKGLPTEDIDVTLARVLDEILAEIEKAETEAEAEAEAEAEKDKKISIKGIVGWPAAGVKVAALFPPAVRQACVEVWHAQPAWPEVAGAIETLRERGYEVVVHGNGTTRLQLDLCSFSGLRFDMLLSSQLLGVYKPEPENYERALKLLARGPEECVLVAAHAYDLRGARRAFPPDDNGSDKGAGIRTIYIYRWTDDVNEDQALIRSENDAYLEDGMHALADTIEELRDL